MNTIVAFEAGFADDAIRKSRWKSFAKKKKISLDILGCVWIAHILYFALRVKTIKPAAE